MTQLQATTDHGHATPAHEILFALAFVDFSQYEYAVFCSAMVYAWGVPQGVKSNMIQVKTTDWLGSLKREPKAFEALARLVERGVIRKTRTARYIINPKLSDWQDLQGSKLFPPNGSHTLKMQGLMNARNYRPTEYVSTPYTGSKPAEEVTESDSPHRDEGLVFTPHTGSKYSPHGDEDPPEPSQQSQPEGATKAYLLKPVKESVNSVEFLETLQFARDVCKITGKKSIDDLKSIACEDGISLNSLRNSLEVLASKSKEQRNPLGLVRKLARQAKTHKLPAGAKTFESWRLQQADNAEISRILGTKPPKQPSNPAKNAQDAALANSFQTRPQKQQDEIINSFKKLRIHAAAVHWADLWLEAARPAWLSWHGGITKTTFVLLENHALELFSNQAETGQKG